VQTRKLGRQGPELTVLGIGTWALGGDGWAGSWGPQDDGVSVAAIRAALAQGATWIDTAPVYGLGHSEAVVGRAIRGIRDEVFIATKCGERFGPDGPFISGARAGVRADCEASLRRLGTDVIDLYQLHHPPSDVLIEETWLAMGELADEGKVRFTGLCNASADEIRRCSGLRPVSSYQAAYSILRPGLEAEVLPLCQELGIGALPFGALGHGFLSEDFDAGRLAPDDWRRDERFADEIRRGREVATRLRPVARSLGLTLGQLTTAWLTGHPAVTAVPVGARSPEQAATTFAASSVDPGTLRKLVSAALDVPAGT
jgi:aryl-alcohol dehydrogenase-like predicted oxidoreductase